MSSTPKSLTEHLEALNLDNVTTHYNLSPDAYETHILADGNKRSALGAVSINTGKFTGRSPKDRYIVKDGFTSDIVDWGQINQPISTEVFNTLKKEITNYLSNKTLFVQDGYAAAESSCAIDIRTIAEKAYSGLFAYNMFRRYEADQLSGFTPDWTILCAPGYLADPSKYEGLDAENFAIINFSEQQIIIGGTGYTGEIKKGIFSVLNCVLPVKHGILPMHCSANVGDSNEDTAIFFGLSGTGKTTLSADPNRLLIGDDEHGWSDTAVFNFEGGCYAKTINLSPEGEPQIFNAIKPGALLENIEYKPQSDEIDFAGNAITENTRVSYPLYHIPEAKDDSMGGMPKNIFFLTCDAFGVLPPVSKLTRQQAMYYFISGYTAKIAGTELGITEPQATFSACFGAPFLPLHPTKYAEMLGDKMDQHKTDIWLINTGWIEGKYGVGHRISLKYTRAIITAALNGELANVDFGNLEGFDLAYPMTCPNVPAEILNPRNSWTDKAAYDNQANELIDLFINNFKQYEAGTTSEILSAQPTLSIAK